MTMDVDNFFKYHERLEAMIAASSKEDVAKCAEFLSLHLAYYKAQYGQLPLAEYRKQLDEYDLEERAKLMADVLREMIISLAATTVSLEEFKEMDLDGWIH